MLKYKLSNLGRDGHYAIKGEPFSNQEIALLISVFFEPFGPYGEAAFVENICHNAAIEDSVVPYDSDVLKAAKEGGKVWVDFLSRKLQKLKKLQMEVEIVRWESIRNTNKFSDHLQTVKELVEKDSDYKDDLEQSRKIVYERRLTKAPPEEKAYKSTEVYRKRFNLHSDNFLIEESAGFIELLLKYPSIKGIMYVAKPFPIFKRIIEHINTEHKLDVCWLELKHRGNPQSKPTVYESDELSTENITPLITLPKLAFFSPKSRHIYMRYYYKV
ncbi:19090_t:CDS:2, partial [Dentiscutata erythropus]